MGIFDTLRDWLTPAPPSGPSTPDAPRFDSQWNTFTGLGGPNDKGQAARPNVTRRPLTDVEIRSEYRFNGIARRLVDFVPLQGTRKGWRVEDDSKEPDPMAEEDKRLKVRARARKAWTMSRRDGGAVLLAVTDDGADPSTPLDLTNLNKVHAFHAFDKFEARPEEWDGDIRSERYLMASMWQITPRAPGFSAGQFVGGRVHHSRIIYFAGVPTTADVWQGNGGFEDSILQGSWDALRNKTSIMQAAAVLVQEMKVNVLKVLGLASKSTGEQWAFFETRMKAMAKQLGMLNMVIVGEGEEYESRGQTISGFKEINDAANEHLAAVSGFPLTVLMGQSPGGLGTEGKSQEGTIDDLVAACQEQDLLEPLTQLYTMLYSAKEGPTGGVVPEQWSINFLPLGEPTEADRAAVQKTHAETDKVRIDSGVLTAEHVARSRYAGHVYGMEIGQVTEAEIAEATEVAAAAAELEAEAAKAKIAGAVNPAANAPGSGDGAGPKGAATGKGGAGAKA